MMHEKYHKEMLEGLNQLIQILEKDKNHCLYSLSIWTDIEAGVSAFSVDTRNNSENFVRTINARHHVMAAQLRADGKDTLAEMLERPLCRNTSPADFALKDIVVINHLSNDESMPSESLNPLIVQPSLLEIRDVAAKIIRRRVNCEPDAEVAISTSRDWYDLPVSIA